MIKRLLESLDLPKGDVKTMSFRLDLGVKWSLRSPPKTEKALMEKSMRAFFYSCPCKP
jgi:hypothetical protein